MEKAFAYQKDSRLPCKYGRKCYQTNQEHLDKYKHPPKKEDVKVVSKKKITKKNVKVVSKKKIKKKNVKNKVGPSIANTQNATRGESSNFNLSNNLNEEDNVNHETNDMEVPEQSNVTIDSEAGSTSTSNNISNSPEHKMRIMLPTSQHSQRQQQLLLTSTALDDSSGDEGIVPRTPTLFVPRRINGEFVSSPHVPTHVPSYIIVKGHQPSRISDSNDSVQLSLSEQTRSGIPHWSSRISQLFLVGEMPSEFYLLWEFCKKICPNEPENALLPVGLKLVGPYDVLAGHMNEFDTNDIEKTVLHWRYYYDPPEFQTIIAKIDKKSQYHIGYFRDQPSHMPCFVVSNDSAKDCTIKIIGRGIFDALRKYLHTTSSRRYKCFSAARRFQKKLLPYNVEYPYTRPRNNRCHKTVSKTFHGIGIIVPYDKKADIGYRPLAESDEVLRTILNNYRDSSESKKIETMEKLQPIITYANIACDECDFGTALELGINIFCDGNPELHRICKQLLVNAYNLLNRSAFGTIIKAHLKNRRKGSKMSIL